ncbi:PRC and DUF2382 domain-containing protein [Planctomonas psychrotolerans]|uniref:PRC and DUF2382 domain-containing protein n=1 Tax=Planctomonas psychrotolerans TaxID=2528712 RepID=UPI001239C2EF|nr:PRC and DUF2382 domain-containing protein [Planctomonas psychrotolerans]
MAITQNNLNDILNNKGNVVSSSGDKIGSAEQFYVDDASGAISWVSVTTGLFGTSESFVPLDNATVQGNDVVVPYTKDQVKDAPRVNTGGGALDENEQDELYRHYGITTGGSYDTTTTGGNFDTTDVDTSRGAGHDTSGPNTDSAMTRSEERVNVGTRSTETGRARLRKYIVTENVTETVPVSHEEVHLEREPITDANVGDALRGGDLTEEEHEVTLHAERPVVEKETVPVERVRLDKDTVTENETVSTDVRKEEIELDTDGDINRTRGNGAL